MTERLRSKGFDVDSCLDGDEALYYASQNIHDVILLDRMLPYMDGTKILAQLRNSEITIPIIFITAPNRILTDKFNPVGIRLSRKTF